MRLRTFADGWNRYFFEPSPVTTVAVFRILFGALILAYGALLAPDLLTWFGQDGAISPATMRRYLVGPRLSVFPLLASGDSSVYLAFGALMVSAFSLMIGFRTRLASILVFVLLVSFHHRNTFILNSGDSVLRVLSFLLIFTHAGAELSVDRLIRVRRGLERVDEVPLRSPWAFRLMQLQFALVYLATFLWKIDGNAWVDGTALYFASRLTEFKGLYVPFFFEYMALIKLGTWAALAIEFALGALFWVRSLRPYLLASGVLLHLGIELTMTIPLFEWIMLSALILFLEPDECVWLGKKIRQAISTLAPARGEARATVGAGARV